MKILLKNVYAHDPQVNLDEKTSILICDGLIEKVAKDIYEDGIDEVRDMHGNIAIPGMVDMHVHFRDPGFEYKETIETGLRAAAHGGYVAVLPMANTNPVCDDGSKVKYLIERANYKKGRTRLIPLGACTKGLKGESLAEIGDMHAFGIKALSDDGCGIQDSGLARRVMDYAKSFDLPVLSHCQVESLAGSGVVNEGFASTHLGMAGWPAAAEEIQIARDIQLAKLTGCHIHIQHVTTVGGAEIIQAAKKEGIPVSCEVTPHHLFLCEDDISDLDYNTNLKMNPPLRTKQDCKALQEALAQGIIDVIATDHAPHAKHEKALEFELAPFGTTGLETSFSLVYTKLINSNKLSWNRFVEASCIKPREILHLEKVSLSAGSVADISIFDTKHKWSVTQDFFESKSVNSAFLGMELQGIASDVYVEGCASLKNGKVMF